MNAEDSKSACAHCGLALGPSPIVDEERAFCCGGCQAVFSAINACGLGAYYTERDGAGVPVPSRSRHYDYFDDPEFQKRNTIVDELAAGALRTELHLEGLHCSACVWLVEKLPTLLDGVDSARLDYADARLEVVWRPNQTSLSAIARCLARLGYDPQPLGMDSRTSYRRQERKLLARIGVAGAAFGNVMLLGFALYSGEAHGMSDEHTELFRWLSFLITLPAVAFAGDVFFRGAWAALRTRAAHMDVPISIGILAALVSGAVNTLRGQGEIYFDSVTMLVFFLLVGRWLQARQLSRAREATDLMLALAPSTSRLITPRGVVEVATESVPEGAELEVRSGEGVSVDGVVVSGTSSLDCSLLTGESQPQPVEPGSSVHAGTVNLSSRLVVRALQTGKATRLAAIVAEVSRAARTKAKVVELADRIAGYFVLVVLSLALVTLAVSWRLGFDVAMSRAVALLIVTCPCALGLATPLAGSVALGRAAKRGILIKGARFLEMLSRPGLFVFDKTGTLTRGTLSVVDWDADASLKSLVLAAESQSAHPVARALREAFLHIASSGTVVEAVRSREVLGGGVSADVSGAPVLVGSRDFVRQRLNDAPAPVPPHLEARERELLQRGLSPVYVAVHGQLRSIIGLGDPVREEARSALLALRAEGHRLALLSGDRMELVESVARQLDVPFDFVLGEQSPEQKLAFVSFQREHGPVFMVGDGVNDAAALAASHVGIAVCGGAEASLAAADVFSTRDGLGPVVSLARGSRRALRVVYVNLVASILYNSFAAALAMFGFIHPLLAAILMPLSSLTIVVNTLRARTFDDELGATKRALASSGMRPMPLQQRSLGMDPVT